MREESEEVVILGALSALSLGNLSHLSLSLLSLNLCHHSRLCCLLSSSTIFSLTLHHLHSLSLSEKSHLIARHLLSSLHHLTLHLHPPPPLPVALSSVISTRDLDALLFLLLLLLCETHRQHADALSRPHVDWRVALRNLYSDTMLTLSHIDSTLITYVDMGMRCKRLVKVLRKERPSKKVAASPVAVVSLPAVEVKDVGSYDSS